MFIRFLVLLAAAVLLFSPPARAETIIDSDTAIYGTIDDDVSIVGAVSAERPPVINLLDSGRIAGDVAVDHAAVLNLSGGTIDGRLDIDGDPLTTVLNFSGTRVGHQIRVRNAIVNISRELFLDPESRASSIDLRESVLNMSAGLIPGGIQLIGEASVAYISGGRVEGALYVSESTLTISGGTFSGIAAVGDSEVHVYGGEIAGTLHASRGGTIHVYGYDLDYSNQVLSGRLADGTELATAVRATIHPDGALVLHEIPEPAVWIGLVSGIAAFMLSRWFRTARRIFLGRRAVILQG